MRKIMVLLVIGLSLSACIVKTGGDPTLQKQVDSLKEQVAKFRPGLGEFMLSVQVHHCKLFFAGSAANWQLAKFEVDEIREQLNHAVAIETDRTEIKSIPMVYPALDSIDAAISAKDTAQFHQQYIRLTNACNECHKAVNFEFNKVKIPDVNPYTNQVW